MRLILLFSMFVSSVPSWADPVVFASTERQASLVELFTSEGCSSCPPADRWLGALREDAGLWKDIVPVAWHVDYWNGLGWRDPYSSARWSARQRAYAKQGGVASVYTPGFVVNGREWRGWFGSRRLPVTDRDAGELRLRLDGDGLVARFRSSVGGRGWRLHVAVLGFGLVSSVEAGENAGRELRHDFVVLDLLEADSPDGHWQLTVPMNRKVLGSKGNSSVNGTG